MLLGHRFTSATLGLAMAVLPACSKDAPVENVRPLGALNGSTSPNGAGVPWAGGATAGASGAGGSEATSGGGAGGSGNASNAAAGGSGLSPSLEGEAQWTFDLPEKPFSKPNLLEAIGHCALASYEEFEGHARRLAASTAALAQSPDDSKMQAARADWRATMASWQRAEPLSFGPAARAAALGGRDLRDNIYAFPLTNYCQIDEQIVAQTYAAPEFATSLGSSRGLSAIEYLLFNTSASNACFSALAINSTGAWTALGDQIWQRRVDYADHAARDVLERAGSLRAAWHPEQGDFFQQLTTAGQGSATFSSAQQAFNAISDALFYIEKEVKDWKLGWPLGLVPDCANAPGLCPSEVESRYAFASTDHLRQNLTGFRRIFQGCGPEHAGLGFDDWLIEAGAPELAASMLDGTRAAQAAVDALDPPLEQALYADPSRVQALHAAIKTITDPLKTEFVTVLNLDLPKAAEGDND
jgi:uncharacterized protein